jgi:hypothetical protein
MENDCHFVSSRGLLKSCSVRSHNPQSSCAHDTGYLDSMEQRENMSVYVCSHLLRTFVNTYLPRIRVHFYLVSGDSDLEVPSEALNDTEFRLLVTNDNLVCWYAQNMTIPDFPKIRNLPIGLDYHTIGSCPDHWWKMHTEGHTPPDQETALTSIALAAKPFHERERRIFSNVHLSPDRYGQRMSATETIPAHLLVKTPQHLSRTQTWKKNTEYSFVLSPYGNGFDCHRTWEALCLGAIPIVKAPQFNRLFEDLPVLNVNSWTDITEELLDKTIKDFKERRFNMDKLKLSYWVSQFSPK